MQWQSLLSLKRWGDTETRLRSEQKETRLAFDVDYDRIVFSDFFRNLQDKTQVIPLSKTGFVHTRLTHSMEVSVVGRSLGRNIGAEILLRHPELYEIGYRLTDFGTIVASAALAHDIGNPPFGHSGEKAIGDFFKHKEGTLLKDRLTEKEYEDLCSFEGNANGFRILTESRAGVQGGLRLTYATLGTFLKYPKESLPKRPSKHIAHKKFNVFQSEKDFFQELTNDLQLVSLPETGYARHPLTFLVEAADDICYTLLDFEDGINLGLISEEVAMELLIKLIQNSQVSPDIVFNKYHSLATRTDRVAYLRALSIGTLVNEVTQIFLDNEQAILNGSFSHSLLSQSQFTHEIDEVLQVSIDNIYKSPQVVEKELAGYAILQNLLARFTTAALNVIDQKPSSYDNLLLKTLPRKYFIGNRTLYEIMLDITCYIASLTDTKATELHQRSIGNI